MQPMDQVLIRQWPSVRFRVSAWGPRSLLLALASATALGILSLIAAVLWMSFKDGIPGEEAPYTLANYRDLLMDPYFYRVMVDTVQFVAVTTIVALVLGVFFAWVIERTDLPGKSLVVSLLTVGILVPGFFTAMGWVFILHPRIGTVNLLLMKHLGLQSPPFNVGTIPWMGFIQGLGLSAVVFVMTAPILRSMNAALTEAAGVHGVSKLRTVLRIEIPLIAPSVLAAGIWVFTIALGVYDIPAIIGMGNNVFTFSTAMYKMLYPAEGLPRYGLSGAWGGVMLVVALLLAHWYFSLLRRGHRYQIISGQGYRPRPVTLGRWRYAVWGVLGLKIALAPVLPLLMVLYASLLPYFRVPSLEAFRSFSLGNYHALPYPFLLAAAKNSLLLFVGVPTISLVLGVAISWIVTRSAISVRGALDTVAFLPHPVPSLMFALAASVLALVVADWIPIYGTVYLVMGTIALINVAFATRMLNGAMVQVHRELEEAAQVGGASPLRIIWKVLLPLIRPTLVYAWLWIGLLAVRELTVPSFLATAKNFVLPTAIYRLWDEPGKAAAAGMLMILVMTPLIVAYWVFGRRMGVAAEAR